jgi:hypothetical protein
VICHALVEIEDRFVCGLEHLRRRATRDRHDEMTVH